MLRPITIVGGGLAGLTLGIGLRQQGVSVVLWEAGHYPRHRVCGEFISGNGLHTLARLGLYDKLRKEDATIARTALFFSSDGKTGQQTLPEPALCLSRHRLDALLAQEFCHLGGELKAGARWKEKMGDEGVVRATGRRPHSEEQGWRLFGIKVHARNVDLAADLEMHFRPDGYIGLCRLADGKVNICGLLRTRTAMPQMTRQWREVLKGEPKRLLHQRLSPASFDEDSFCFVAGISLRPQRALAGNECAVGDAVTMIPPLTGNGMSMAFESAELAIEPLKQYSLGASNWDTAQRTIGAACDRHFRRRLMWANWMQRILMNASLQGAVLGLGSRSYRFWEYLFSKTR